MILDIYSENRTRGGYVMHGGGMILENIRCIVCIKHLIIPHKKPPRFPRSKFFLFLYFTNNFISRKSFSRCKCCQTNQYF